MTLDARRAGDALAASAADLARTWRSARMAARVERFPGLLDGLVEPFFALAGDALAEGRDPALVWPATVGVVRLDARDPRRTRADVDAEWDLAEGVLHAACRALDAGDAAREWVSRAVVIARTGTRSLTRGGPRGILVVRLHRATGVRRRGRAPAPR
jgi:hypothetical protein